MTQQPARSTESPLSRPGCPKADLRPEIGAQGNSGIRATVDALLACLPMSEDGTGHVADCGFDFDAIPSCGCYSLPGRMAEVVESLIAARVLSGARIVSSDGTENCMDDVLARLRTALDAAHTPPTPQAEVIEAARLVAHSLLTMRNEGHIMLGADWPEAQGLIDALAAAPTPPAEAEEQVSARCGRRDEHPLHPMPCDSGCQPDWHRDDCAIYGTCPGLTPPTTDAEEAQS